MIQIILWLNINCMSKKYQYFAKKRCSMLYEGACDLKHCKLKKSHFYTTDCLRCLDRCKRVGRTRWLQQAKDNQKIIVPV